METEMEAKMKEVGEEMLKAGEEGAEMTKMEGAGTEKLKLGESETEKQDSRRPGLRTWLSGEDGQLEVEFVFLDCDEV